MRLPSNLSRRCYHRLLGRYSPTYKKEHVDSGTLESLRLLLRAGYVRQSSAGIYSYLPNGVRVLNNLERIIDEEMQLIGASKVSLPSVLSSSLWEKSGRWVSTGQELLRIKDRKGSNFLYAPTHEEEITDLVRQSVTSWRDLPVKVYQIGRKFRDEARPRSGLLRSREFIMKDLYTFDTSIKDARKSYKEVKKAYKRIFDRIGVPFVMVDADSGNMGGSTSHEYGYITSAGEDTIIRCKACRYSANTEVAKLGYSSSDATHSTDTIGAAYDSPSSNTLICAVSASNRKIDVNRILGHYPDAQLIESCHGVRELDSWENFDVLIDRSAASQDEEAIHQQVSRTLQSLISPCGSSTANKDEEVLITDPESIWPRVPSYKVVDIRKIEPDMPKGDTCGRCGSKQIECSTTIEVGHTFILGTRYSGEDALNATYVSPDQTKIPIEMGCYGIGVSRIMAAVAEKLKDKKGLVWPVSIAPYKVALIPTFKISPSFYDSVQMLSDELCNISQGNITQDDIIVDDRPVSFGSRMADAELVGYSAIIVLGKAWEKELLNIQPQENLKERFSSVTIDGKSRDGEWIFNGSMDTVVQITNNFLKKPGSLYLIDK